MGDHSIDAVNDLDREAFVDRLGGIYEHSPWVAELSWSDRPFDSIDDLHESMKRAVRGAPREQCLELLREHPDLGEQTEMTDASAAEQSSAGLDQLSPVQYERFQELNETYRNRFGFPFIMAVKDESQDAIQAAMETRIENSETAEFRTALAEVHKIARLRLEDELS